MKEVNITKLNFEEEVINSTVPVLLDFWASWCGPCKMMLPIVGKIADEYYGQVKVGKVNVEEEEELAKTFNISSIPTFIFVKNGKIVNKMVGYRPKTDIINMIENN